MNKIAITGKTSRFAKILSKSFNGKNIIYTSKNQIDILNIKSIERFIKIKKIKTLIHLAGLSRPMEIHQKNIIKSINLNIIGTANIVNVCKKYNVKLIFFSTNYVYPGIKGPYNEKDPLLPFNNYGWSKLGAESAVQMYKNSLILRICMTERPFIHKRAFNNVISSFIFQDKFASHFRKLLNHKGIINIGGERRSIYSFAKKSNKKIKSILSKSVNLDTSIDIKKFKSIIK
jgi:dTDP-4-dehydrorhamnose reductase